MKNRGPRGAITAILVLGVIIFVGVYFAWNTATNAFQPVSSGTSPNIEVQIRPDETTQQIADDLANKHIIRNAFTFRIWARIKGLDTRLQAGVYTNINASMTIDQIVSNLLSNSPDQFLVSVPEGLRVEEIAQRFADNPNLAKFSAKDFLKYTKNPKTFPDAAQFPILKSIPDNGSMDGLLFADTYAVPATGTARQVIDQMLTEYSTAISTNGLAAKAKANQMTTYQMTILASMVEKEVVHRSDSPGVAGVYWNRVFRPNDETVGYMNSDPSVAYARGLRPGSKDQYWGQLGDTGGNIAAGSPWNTYTHKGFPPTPICSVSLSSLEAAASPTKSDNYYFLSIPSGKVLYTKTLQEFTNLANQYNVH